MARANAGLAKHGEIVLAEEQTSGRGQRGSSWISQKGESLCFSLLLEPGGLPLAQQNRLSILSALACLDWLKSQTEPGAILEGFRLKWPNDLYWCDRKAGGILIENIVHGGHWTWAVIGIGINLNQLQFPDDLPNPVSLKQITGHKVDPSTAATEIVTHFNHRLAQWRAEDFASLLNDYNKALYRCGEKVRLKKDNRVFSAELRAVTEDGRLVAFTSMEEFFNVGEVKLV